MNGSLKKKVMDLCLLEATLGGSGCGCAPYRLTKSIGVNNSKSYKNKNSNIEYYTDEKGNIRKRKRG